MVKLKNIDKMYHQDTTHISKSGLDLINRAPAHYYHRYFNGGNNSINSRALVQGTAFHSFALEPELINSEFTVMPKFSGKGSQSKKNEFLQMNSDKLIIKMDEFNMVNGMVNSLMSHPISKYLTGGVAEKPIFWIDPTTGVACKCKPDYLKGSLIIDLKSTEDASEIGIKKSVRKFRYDVQSAFYTDGGNESGLDIKGFLFIFVEKAPPYLVNAIILSNEDINNARIKYIENLETYKVCKNTGNWYGYGDNVSVIDLGW